VINRRLGLCIAAGLVALTVGLSAEIFDQTMLGVVAGMFGLLAALAGTALGVEARVAEEHLQTVDQDRARLRRELDALADLWSAEGNRPREDPDSAVIDHASGLFDENFFSVIVQQRVAAARRQLQPVSVVVFELDALANADTASKDRAIAILGDVMRRTLRECDSACRIGGVRAAAVLEDTEEAGAVWAAERVRGTLNATKIDGGYTISAGIACYPSHALNAEDLVEQADRALELARGQGSDHVEIAPVD
jgi:diguanylate cyclase (GGDEF)-like protein